MAIVSGASRSTVAQRPKVLWIELEPLQPTSDQGSTYVICDPFWRSATTQPTLSLGLETGLMKSSGQPSSFGAVISLPAAWSS